MSGKKRKNKSGASNALEVQNAAKTLYANIRFMSVDDPIRSVVITSTAPNEGKTTTAVQLGRAMATAGKTVLLVEADMRRRSLAAMLEVHPQAGLYAVLSGAAPLSAAIASTSTPNLYFLDTEPNIPNPADIISSKRYRALAAKLAERFDYVIFDTPPVGTFVDAAVLSTMADGLVLVVRPGEVKRSALVGAYDQLRKADANVLGICATFCEGTGSEYYYAYYTSDGHRVKDQQAYREQEQKRQAVSEGGSVPVDQTASPTVQARGLAGGRRTQAANKRRDSRAR